MMKTLKCDLCEVTLQGEFFEDWMKALILHYAQVHPDVAHDSQGDMQKWMAQSEARFRAA